MAQLKSGSTAGGEVIATRDWVTSTIIGGAPAALDTLNELAAAIGDNASYASSITTALAGKLSTTGKAADSDKVDGYHASNLWRSDGATWNPSANISLNQSGNSQEWSFDIRRNGYTGGYWQVWDSELSTMLKVDASNGRVYAPYDFVGNLQGNITGSAASATTAGSATTATTATNLGADYTADDWFRATGDNNHVKFYGNSRQMMWRTDGTTEAYSGVGGYPFVWTYNGSSSGNRIMILHTDGRLWTSRYGWLDTAFDAAGSASSVNSRIDNEIIPTITAAQDTADGAVTTANSALTTAQTAEARANSAREDAAAIGDSLSGYLTTSGKAADANLLDGINSSSFLRKDTDQTITNTGVEISFYSADDGGSATGDLATLEVYQDTVSADAFMQFHVGGDYAAYFGLAGDWNDFFVGGWSMGNVRYRVWHSGNDGSGSGLDADTVDGINAASFIRSDADDNVTANTEWQDNKQIRLGNGADLRMWHDGNNHYFRSYNHGANYYFQGEDNEGTNHNMLILQAETSRPYVRLYENGGERLRTTSSGVEVLGTARVSGGITSTNSGGYGIIRGYDNDNHFIVIRGGVTTGQSTLEITGSHKTTFVEHADDSNEGWYFVSKASGNYTEKARIDGLGNIYSSNIITNQANIQSLTSDGTIDNDKGSYLHLGGWAVSRTHASAVLVNTAYRSDILSYARNFTIGNTARSFNGSANVSWSLADIGAESAGAAAAVNNRITEDIVPTVTAAQNAANSAQSTADTALSDAGKAATAAANAQATADAANTLAGTKAALGGSYGQDFKADDMRVDQWFRNTASGKGIYNEATGQHFYSDDDDYWNIAGGSAANGLRFRDEHAGNIRGYVYANNSNEVGFLDAGGSWAIKHSNDNGTRFYTDGSTEEFKVGRDAVTGNYGTVQTVTTRGGWGGYSINGQYALMSDHGSIVGIFNDIDNEWMAIFRRNSSVDLYHNGATRFITTSGGVKVMGNLEISTGNITGVTTISATNITVSNRVTADSFVGDGSGLTGISAGADPVAFEDSTRGTNSTLVSMAFDGRAMIFTMADGSQFAIDGARPN